MNNKKIKMIVSNREFLSLVDRVKDNDNNEKEIDLKATIVLNLTRGKKTSELTESRLTRSFLFLVKLTRI